MRFFVPKNCKTAYDKDMYTITDLFNLSHTKAKAYFKKFTYPHEVLLGIGAFIFELSKNLPEDYYQIFPKVWAHKSVKVAGTAYIGENCILGEGTEVRQGAFIRGNALIGDNCVVGNSTEIKNAILFDGVQVPHYNYIGDSIFGYKSHFGAGSITSNIKSDKTDVCIRFGNEKYDTGMRKVGAFVGDYAEIGCNSVLNPGTVIGRRAQVYPLSCIRGTVKENHIYKNEKEVIKRYE